MSFWKHVMCMSCCIITQENFVTWRLKHWIFGSQKKGANKLKPVPQIKVLTLCAKLRCFCLILAIILNTHNNQTIKTIKKMPLSQPTITTKKKISGDHLRYKWAGNLFSSHEGWIMPPGLSCISHCIKQKSSVPVKMGLNGKVPDSLHKIEFLPSETGTADQMLKGVT